MAINRKGFRTFVTVFVVLTGAGFGGLTGGIYSEGSYWLVGMVLGIACGYPLAQLYLWQLAGSFAKRYSKMVTWFYGTFIAIICGIICTSVVHGVMMLFVYIENPFASNDFPGVVIFGEIIGAAAGLVVGGICSWIAVGLYANGIEKETSFEN